MRQYIKIIRPHQWIKNGFVFLPMFFGGSLTDTHDLITAMLTFIAFSFTASSVYCFNDIVDVDADRRHDVKRHRPIASGAISIGRAYLLMAVMLVLAVAALSFIDEGQQHTAVVIAAYYAINLLYCKILKQYAIVDVCVIAAGFVLRILAGGFATGVAISHWLILMTFLLTLFLSFAKRRDDVLLLNKTGEAPRKNTIRYNLTFINQAITITASVTLVCYVMYTVSPEVTARFNSQYIYLTSIFVVLGLLRYIQITVVDEKSGDPTKVVLHDRFTQMIILGWGLAFLFIIYL